MKDPVCGMTVPLGQGVSRWSIGPRIGEWIADAAQEAREFYEKLQ